MFDKFKKNVMAPRVNWLDASYYPISNACDWAELFGLVIIAGSIAVKAITTVSISEKEGKKGCIAEFITACDWPD